MRRQNLVFLAALIAVPVLAADVGVSISIGQPGFYGRIDLGDFPPPRLVYRQPIMVERIAVERPPIYLHVPPRHSKNWRKHCREYNACGERVYFVQNRWYDREYVPRYQERHHQRRDDDRRDDHRGDRNDHRDNGPGYGRNH